MPAARREQMRAALRLSDMPRDIAQASWQAFPFCHDLRLGQVVPAGICGTRGSEHSI